MLIIYILSLFTLKYNLMKTDFNLPSIKEDKAKNSVESESFPHVLLLNDPMYLSNNESNSSSPRLSRDLSAENHCINFLPKDLLNKLDNCSFSNNDIIEENNIKKKNNSIIYSENNENDENNEEDSEKKNFENDNPRDEFDNRFFRKTICKFPKLEENTNISENESKYSLKDEKEDEYIQNSNKESSENLLTIDSNRKNKNQKNFNYSEKNIQSYQNNKNINQGIFDSKINPYVHRVRSEVSLNNPQLVQNEISEYYYTNPNEIKPKMNSLPFNLNGKKSTENIKQYLNNNKNFADDNKFSFSQNPEIFSYDNNSNCQNINAQLHYSAGFGKRIDNNFMHNSINNNFMHNSINNFNKNKEKKAKKKRKHKEDDEYIIEMFGRRGWICEECNNFNYESRNKCNRCKIPKKAIKIKTIIDNNGQKELIDNVININHKDDWICYNCKNVNYAFRLVCNRCQFSKEDSIKASTIAENNLD